MTPLFFGHGGRRLFGAYSPARSRAGQGRVVVLCNPWGQEYLRAHRSMKQLAVMLSDAGFHVMRFDYYGTGDSSGDMTGADLEGWVGDIATAIQEIQDTTGASRVRMVGLRLGATLAAMSAVRQRGVVEGLVLWDPVVSGSEYLEELLAAQAWTVDGPVASPQRPAHSGGGHEVLGFALTERMAKELQAVELLPLVGALPPRLLALATGPLAGADRLRLALQARTGAAAEIEEIPCLPAWLEDRNTGAGAIPLPAMQRIVQWMQ